MSICKRERPFICRHTGEKKIYKALITRPRLKAGGRVLNPARFVCLFGFFFFGVANRYSLDADWSQIGNLETLIGSRARAVFRSRPLATSFSVKKHEIMVLACQVGTFHLTLTQINLERNYIAKNKNLALRARS